MTGELAVEGSGGGGDDLPFAKVMGERRKEKSEMEAFFLMV